MCGCFLGKKALSPKIKFYFANITTLRDFDFDFDLLIFFSSSASRGEKAPDFAAFYALVSVVSGLWTFFLSFTGKDFGRSQNARRFDKKKKRRTRDI